VVARELVMSAERTHAAVVVRVALVNPAPTALATPDVPVVNTTAKVAPAALDLVLSSARKVLAGTTGAVTLM